jgi:hypothetical protein
MPTASPLISRAQVGGGRVRAAGKTLVSGGDKPVIGFAADIGASGRSALHGCNQVRVARLGHCETSKKTDCESNFAVLWSADSERTWRMACNRKATSEVTTFRVSRCEVRDRWQWPATWDSSGVTLMRDLVTASALIPIGGRDKSMSPGKPPEADLCRQL